MVKGDANMDRPGREIPKDYREVAVELVEHQGWRYDAKRHGGHPTLYPPTGPLLTIPTTPSKRARSFENWVAEVRRRGGQWPPKRRK